MKPTRECITHHFACDCREAMFAEALQTQRRVVDWQNQSDEGLRRRCGELTAQEIRTIRAVLNAILPNAKGLPPEGLAAPTCSHLNDQPQDNE